MIYLLSFCLSFLQVGKTQEITDGFWLPLKRLEHIRELREDNCDSAIAFPLKKIKFLSNKEVSLFGFNAADPSVCSITQQQDPHTWKVEDSILHTLYPQYVMGSKILLRLKKDTLYVYLSKNGVTFSQQFVRKYGNVKFTDYRETEVGNVYIKGIYLNETNSDTIIFKDNGKMVIRYKKGTAGLNFTSYRFKYYAPGSCSVGESMARGVVEFSDAKGNKKEFFIKDSKTGIEVYKIIKMYRWWSDAEIEKVYSLSYLESP